MTGSLILLGLFVLMIIGGVIIARKLDAQNRKLLDEIKELDKEVEELIYKNGYFDGYHAHSHGKEYDDTLPIGKR